MDSQLSKQPPPKSETPVGRLPESLLQEARKLQDLGTTITPQRMLPLRDDSPRGHPKATPQRLRDLATTAQTKSPVIEPNNNGYGVGEENV